MFAGAKTRFIRSRGKRPFRYVPGLRNDSIVAGGKTRFIRSFQGETPIRYVPGLKTPGYKQ